MKQARSTLRYAPWLARDVAAGPGILYLVITIVVCVVIWRLSRTAGAGASPEPAEIQRQAMNVVTLVMCLIAAGGMVSGDMHAGFYRAYFSKPMPTWWYYLQRWLLGGVAVLLVPVAFGLGLQVIFGNGLGITGSLMATLALGYLLIGGTVLLLSVFTRRDWLIVFILAQAQRGVGQLIESGLPVSSTLKAVWRALPPYHLIRPSQAEVLHGTQLTHVMAYGLAMVVVALVLLRVRPLGSGGRA